MLQTETRRRGYFYELRSVTVRPLVEGHRDRVMTPHDRALDPAREFDIIMSLVGLSLRRENGASSIDDLRVRRELMLVDQDLPLGWFCGGGRFEGLRSDLASDQILQVIIS